MIAVIMIVVFALLRPITLSFYCKYYSQGNVVFLVSNAHVDSKLLTDYYYH